MFPKLSSSVWVLFAGLGAVALALIVNYSFLSEIGNFSSGYQDNYIIDGYYYIYLGEKAVSIAAATGDGLYVVADSIRPNIGSAGIVFLSALSTIMADSRELLPLIFGFLYLVIYFLLARERVVCRDNIFLLFCGLLPYLFIPSKEAFFVIGFLLIYLAYLRLAYIPLGVVGIVLMYLARSEAFFIFLVSFVLAYLWRKSWCSVLFIFLLFLVVYVVFFRDQVYLFSSFFQSAAENADTKFCNVGPFPVCINSSSGMEAVFLSRLLTLTLLPLKWIYDFCMWFLSSDQNYFSSFFIKFSLVLHVFWFYSCWNKVKCSLTLGNFGFVFFAVYVFVYGAILYFQSTRQVVLASTIFLFLAASEKKSRGF